MEKKEPMVDFITNDGILVECDDVDQEEAKRRLEAYRDLLKKPENRD